MSSSQSDAYLHVRSPPPVSMPVPPIPQPRRSMKGDRKGYMDLRDQIKSYVESVLGRQVTSHSRNPINYLNSNEFEWVFSAQYPGFPHHAISEFRQDNVDACTAALNAGHITARPVVLLTTTELPESDPVRKRKSRPDRETMVELVRKKVLTMIEEETGVLESIDDVAEILTGASVIMDGLAWSLQNGYHFPFGGPTPNMNKLQLTNWSNNELEGTIQAIDTGDLKLRPYTAESGARGIRVLRRKDRPRRSQAREAPTGSQSHVSSAISRHRRPAPSASDSITVELGNSGPSLRNNEILLDRARGDHENQPKRIQTQFQKVKEAMEVMERLVQDLAPAKDSEIKLLKDLIHAKDLEIRRQQDLVNARDVQVGQLEARLQELAAQKASDEAAREVAIRKEARTPHEQSRDLIRDLCKRLGIESAEDERVVEEGRVTRHDHRKSRHAPPSVTRSRSEDSVSEASFQQEESPLRHFSQDFVHQLTGGKNQLFSSMTDKTYISRTTDIKKLIIIDPQHQFKAPRTADEGGTVFLVDGDPADGNRGVGGDQRMIPALRSGADGSYSYIGNYAITSTGTVDVDSWKKWPIRAQRSFAKGLLRSDWGFKILADKGLQTRVRLISDEDCKIKEVLGLFGGAPELCLRMRSYRLDGPFKSEPDSEDLFSAWEMFSARQRHARGPLQEVPNGPGDSSSSSSREGTDWVESGGRSDLSGSKRKAIPQVLLQTTNKRQRES